jgi:3-oxoadipate enol-lactonase
MEGSATRAVDGTGAGVPPGRRVELPGRGTTFVREVTGPPGAPVVALLHGLSATGGLNWFPAFGALGRHFRVLAVDHRGHGRGIRTRQTFRLEDCADDVAALAGVLKVERLVAVGYSMGGPVAQLLWRRHRDLVCSLVLCATSRNFGGSLAERLFFSTLPVANAAIRLTPRPLHREAVGRLLAVRPHDPPRRQWALDEFRRNSPRAVVQATGALGRFTSHRWIGEVDVPTAVVVTTRDRLVPPTRQRRLAAAVPGATVHPVQGDHDACVTAARRFVPALVEACQSVATRAGSC